MHIYAYANDHNSGHAESLFNIYLDLLKFNIKPSNMHARSMHLQVKYILNILKLRIEISRKRSCLFVFSVCS